MEFNEKLQALRKQKSLTQEELARAIYVSRTAVSKWESGRGYPSIDSLKAIAKFFGVTIDDLLSGEEVITIAEQERRQSVARLRSRAFSLMDLSAALLLFLPLFVSRVSGGIRAVSLAGMDGAAPWLKSAYFLFVILMTAAGALSPALKKYGGNRLRNASLALNAAFALLLIAGSQPYAAAFTFMLLIIKGILLIKPQ